MDLEELLRNITYEIDSWLSTSEDGGLPHEFFMRWCVDQLSDIGEVEDVIACSHEERGRAVHGFAYSDHDCRLDLFITEYKRASSEYTVYKNDCDTFSKRIETPSDRVPNFSLTFIPRLEKRTIRV